ncbi:MAG: SAM-dependent methyltransferase [Candidatus Hodgkinia cicadicola]
MLNSFTALVCLIKLAIVAQLVLLWLITAFSSFAYTNMLLVIGSGPGAVHFINLCAFAILEVCDAVLVESLVNRSLLTLLSSECKLKYIGRSLHSAYNSFYGILLSVLRLSAAQVTAAWLKNGNALLYSRGWSLSTFLAALHISYIVIPGIASAMAALSLVCVSATSQHLNSVALSLSWQRHDKFITHTLVVYMIRLSALTAFDSLVCGGLASDKVVMLICSLSLAAQTVVYSSFCSFLFALANADLNAPSLLVVGCLVYSHVNLNWLKLAEGVNNIVS